MKKQIAILGSTGSIGTQALQVIEEHPDRYEAYVLTANNRVEDLIAQARKFKPEAVVIANETKYQQLKDALADLPIKVYAGEEALDVYKRQVYGSGIFYRYFTQHNIRTDFKRYI